MSGNSSEMTNAITSLAKVQVSLSKLPTVLIGGRNVTEQLLCQVAETQETLRKLEISGVEVESIHNVLKENRTKYFSRRTALSWVTILTVLASIPIHFFINYKSHNLNQPNSPVIINNNLGGAGQKIGAYNVGVVGSTDTHNTDESVALPVSITPSMQKVGEKIAIKLPHQNNESASLSVVWVYDSENKGRDIALARKFNNSGIAKAVPKGLWRRYFSSPYIYFNKRDANAELIEAARKLIDIDDTQELQANQSESQSVKKIFRKGNNVAIAIVL